MLAFNFRSLLARSVALLGCVFIAPEIGFGQQPNVLFVAIDDLNDWIGCLDGHPQVQTPHIDELASRGVLFTEAHCAAPVCGPSRAAIMSGLRPWTSGVYSNDANYPKVLPQAESMPEYLRRHGYFTLGTGKLFHGDTKFPKGSFDRYSPSFDKPWPSDAILSSKQTPSYRWNVGGKQILFPRNGMPADRTWKDTHTFDWGPLDIPDDEFRDAASINWSIQQLSESIREPFFFGVGFHLPHQPLYAPKRFHELYPLDKVMLPRSREDDLNDLSQAGRDYALIPTTSGTHATVVRFGQWENAVSSYLACVTFVDHLVGKLLDSLDSSPYADNTWVVLWSDHGWHLGEKNHWGKATGWHRSTRVPLMIVPPKSDRPEGFVRGARCDQPVNLIDLFPTVNEICRLPKKEALEGTSLIPLVEDPAAPWLDESITTFGRGNHAVSTRRWRFIQYFDGSFELYDRLADPNEWKNLALDPSYKNVANEMRQRVPDDQAWKHLVRYKHFKAAVPSDGKPMLLFNHAVENHLEERYDESSEYPEIVATISNWLDSHPNAGKRITIP